MKIKKLDIITLITSSLFLLLLILILVVDVRINLLTGKEIGLYSINSIFLKNTINNTLDLLSDIILYISIGCVVFYMCLGLIKIIRKNEVDNSILYIGIMMIFMMAIWIMFDKILIINYRPIYIDMELEGSFPSTHILVSTFIMLVNCLFVNDRINDKKIKISLCFLFVTLIILACVLRLLSNMHWFTDIIGGLLLGIILFEIYYKLLIRKKN